MENEVVAEIEKNATEKIRVRVSEFKGKGYIDVRAFVAKEDGRVVATKKGITFDLLKVDTVIDALRTAQRKAAAIGLMNGGDRDGVAGVDR